MAVIAGSRERTKKPNILHGPNFTTYLRCGLDHAWLVEARPEFLDSFLEPLEPFTPHLSGKTGASLRPHDGRQKKWIIPVSSR